MHQTVEEPGVLQELGGRVAADLLAGGRHVFEPSVAPPPELPVMGEVGDGAVRDSARAISCSMRRRRRSWRTRPATSTLSSAMTASPSPIARPCCSNRLGCRYRITLPDGSVRCWSPQRSSSRASNMGTTPGSATRGISDGASPPRTRSASSADTFPAVPMLTRTPPRIPAPRSSRTTPNTGRRLAREIRARVRWSRRHDPTHPGRSFRRAPARRRAAGQPGTPPAPG